jgi:two-component system nitrate/nitrite response regulator NarL
MEALRILLVDKHVLFRKALTSLLAPYPSLQVVGEAESGQDAIVRARETAPDVILMDVVVPKSEGLDVMRVIKREMPQVQIIGASLSDGEHELFVAVKSGADGYLRKNDDPALLFGMLEAVRLGQAPVSRPLASQILQEFREMDDPTGLSYSVKGRLSQTETRVLELVAEDWSTYEIADALAIAVDAIRLHLHNVLAKLHRLNDLPVAVTSIPQTVGMGIASE